jgi:hypothetical protein
MKIKQEPKYQPITIVLETAEEADAMYSLVAGLNIEKHRKKLNKLCDWFSEKAQLIGG